MFMALGVAVLSGDTLKLCIVFTFSMNGAGVPS